MSKFNIFDKSTWQVAVKDQQDIITNKAVGTIGQLISQLRSIKELLEKRDPSAPTQNSEYGPVQTITRKVQFLSFPLWP